MTPDLTNLNSNRREEEKKHDIGNKNAKKDRQMNIFKLTPSVVTSALVATFISSGAFAQEACSAYTVKPGDTLGSIAEAAFGSFDYQQIFNANRNVITNPNDVEEGTLLQIPCEDGSLAGGVSSQELIQQQENIQATRAKTSNVYQPPLKLVSGNGWAPFTGEALEGGGMLVRLATTAMNRGGNDRDYSLSFIDDWGSHMETLLPIGAFDVSIAWYIPDCTKFDLLSEGMQKRCTELDASLPIYESVVAFYTAPDSKYADARNYSDYAGARICRPEGWYTFDLEEQGLVPPVIDMIQPAQPVDCFEAIMNGEADVTPMEIESAQSEINGLNAADKFVQNPYLTNVLSLSFVTHKTNPRGRVYLALLNRGLTEMRESGEWYSDSLARANNLTN